MLTPSELASEVCGYRGRVIRIVEAQHRISTNRLSANADEQALLEALADDVKPSLPEAAQNLPWLLASPFRYGLGRPSRFRAADVLPGIFYASEDIETAVTEAAYWRLVAFSRSPEFQRPITPTPMSAFSVMVTTPHAVDLTQGTLAAQEREWRHPTDYSATQALAALARQSDIAVIRTASARRPQGINLAVLDATALVPPPRPHSSWALLATPEGILAAQEMSTVAMRFSNRAFGITD
jgi:RES domain